MRRTLPVVAAFLVWTGISHAASPWWDANWRFRVPVTVDPAGVSRTMKPAEVALNFTQVLSTLGQSGTFSEASLRVVEVNGAGAVIDDSVEFQFDKDADFQPATKASGTLIILLDGTTAAGSQRVYHVYFDLTTQSFTPATFAPRVSYTDNVLDEGQFAYRIQTENATYFYHKEGAGFSSILDTSGNDWIGFHPTYPGSTAGGPSRGLPNCVYPRGYFHPGFTSSSTTLVSSGPLKFTVNSATVADDWSCRWEIYPRYARFTMLSGDSTYWVLYEGTPGGLLEVSKDIVVTSDSVQVLASQTWIRDIPGDEWAYFGDPTVNRSFFVANHNPDDIVDSYRPMDGLMTVFGFGREHTSSYLTQFPAQYSVGLVDAVDFTTMSAAITGAYKDLLVTAGSPEMNTLPGVPVELSPENGSTNQPQVVTFRWSSSPLSILYGLQVAADSLFTGGFAVNDSAIADTQRTVTGLSSSRTYFWRVFCRNASGRGPYSDTWRFATAGSAPAAVVLESPADLAAVISDSVVFTWQPAQPDADLYWFELGFDEAFTFRVVDSTIVDTSNVAHGLVKNHTYYWRVKARNGMGWGPFSDVRRVQTTLTDVGGAAELPGRFSLSQNYPNPFNPETTIEYEIAGGGSTGAGASMVTLAVFDLLGREVARLVEGVQQPGTYRVRFSPSVQAGGMYIYRLDARPVSGGDAGSFSAVRTLLFLK
jgi:hypothetical protein